MVIETLGQKGGQGCNVCHPQIHHLKDSIPLEEKIGKQSPWSTLVLNAPCQYQNKLYNYKQLDILVFLELVYGLYITWKDESNGINKTTNKFENAQQTGTCSWI